MSLCNGKLHFSMQDEDCDFSATFGLHCEKENGHKGSHQHESTSDYQHFTLTWEDAKLETCAECAGLFHPGELRYYDGKGILCKRCWSECFDREHPK